jgi:hypothetical protein
MNIVNTTAPIAIEELKKYFADKDTKYLIDYKNSQLKDKKLLIYLSNLEIPCDIDFKNCEDNEVDEIVSEYLNLSSLVNIPILENIVTNLLLQQKNIIPETKKELLEKNKEIIEKWISKLESLTLYNMYIIGDNCFEEFLDKFEKDDTDNLQGINFVSLLKNDYFFTFYQKMSGQPLKFYNKLFTEYMIKGKNMYSYWANENNPMFLLTFGITQGLVTGDNYVVAKKVSVEEITEQIK